MEEVKKINEKLSRNASSQESIVQGKIAAQQAILYVIDDFCLLVVCLMWKCCFIGLTMIVDVLTRH